MLMFQMSKAAEGLKYLDLPTEKRNPLSADLHLLSATQIIELINKADAIAIDLAGGGRT